MRRHVVVRWIAVLCVFALTPATYGRVLVAQQAVASGGAARTDAKQGEALLARPVTAHAKHVSRRQAINLLAKSGQVIVQYRVPLLDAFPDSVDVNVTNVPLGIALERVLSGTMLRVVPDAGKWLSIVSLDVAMDSIPAVGTISGRVLDSASGKGVGGTTVKVQGTKVSAISSDSGRFTLHDVPVGDRFVTARVFGHRPITEEVTVVANEVAMMRIVTAAVPNLLSGVVTTATGVQRKLEVGSDITTLNVDSIRQVAPISSVTDLLATRVPGLTVVHSSGVPGDPARLRLRGAGSIQLNNDPIVIVDGIRVYASQSDPRNGNLAPTTGSSSSGRYVSGYNAPSPLDQIDPSSIETIEVLKGPSASAIYGSDAASGVIVITTKRGQAGPARWSADLVAGVNWLPGAWPTNYYRFGYDEAANGPLCLWYDVSCKVDSLIPFQALNDSRYSVFTHGSNQQASLTVLGGVPTLTYSVTGSMQATLGNLKLPGSEVQRYDSLYGARYGLISHSLVRPDKYTTWGVTGSLQASPRPTVTATLQSSVFSSTQGQSSLQNAITQLSGEYVSPTFITGPLLTQEYLRVIDDQQTVNNTLALQWRPQPWLPITATAGTSTSQRNDVSSVPFGVYNGSYFNDGDIARPSNPQDTTGAYGVGRGNARVTTVATGTEIPTFRRKIIAAVGGNFYSMSTTDFQVYTDQLSPGITVPTSFLARCTDRTVTCNSPTSQRTSAQSTYGWYLEPRLNFASRFFAAPGFRLDGGSGGTKNSGFGGLSGFPKMDLSYVAVDRQDERPLWGAISLFRPRLAFGYAGTQPAPADKLRLYNIGSYNITPVGVPTTSQLITGSSSGCPDAGGTVTLDGITRTPAVCINALGNTLLRPERSSELEAGFDATLWQNRLSLTYSHYNKTRHDAIIPVPVAQSVYSAGAEQFLIQKNIGVVRNTGTEMTLTATPLQSRTLGWTLGANFSKNTNVVIRLNQGQLPIVLSGGAAGSGGFESRVQAGYPLFADFVRPIVSYADANQDGIIEPNEIRYSDSTVYAGQPNPNYQINVTNDIALLNGQLSVHAGVAYESGLTQYNEGACGSHAFNLLPNAPNTPLATQAAVTAAGCVAGASPNSAIGLIQTVNTFRFQSLSINYVVPRRFANLVRVPRLSVALQGNNLGLHTNYRGKDPDVNAFATVSAGDQTRDRGQIPEPRTWLLHITVGN